MIKPGLAGRTFGYLIAYSIPVRNPRAKNTMPQQCTRTCDQYVPPREPTRSVIGTEKFLRGLRTLVVRVGVSDVFAVVALAESAAAHVLCT